MRQADRVRLLFGPYRTPRCRVGRRVRCLARGAVTVHALTDAPIPWPVGKRGRARALIVCGRLVEAVEREAEQAVAHWWGVTPQTVWKWRKALEVGPYTEGTRRLKRDHALGPAITAALAKAQAKARDPRRRAKIVASKLGKPRPRHVVEAVIAAHLGHRHSEATRRRMSRTHRRRRTRPPQGRPTVDARGR